MPDYRGVRWDRVRTRAEKDGLTDQEDYDAAADNARHAYIDSDWVVVTQDPAPGSPVKSKHVKFGRIKTIEAEHFLQGLYGYVVALAPPPTLPERNDLLSGAVAFCDDLYGGPGARRLLSDRSGVVELAHREVAQLE